MAIHRPSPEAPTDCVDQYEAPLFDTIVAVGAVALTGARAIADAAGSPSADGRHQYNDVGFVVLGALPVFVANGFSALWGWDTRAICKRARAEHREDPASSVSLARPRT